MTMVGPLLVVVDFDTDTTPTQTSLQALSVTRTLTPDTIALALVAPGADAHASTLAEYGAERILTVDTSGVSLRESAAGAEAVLAALDATNASGVILTSHYLGREIAARVAIARGVTPIVDVSRIWQTDGELHLSKPALAGAWDVTVKRDTDIVVAAVRPGFAEATPIPGAGVVEALPVEFSPLASAVRVVESQPQERTGRTPLPEAQVVVVAGRGVEGDLTPVNDLADILGAAVGATRVVTDEGWAPRSLQVGQTGVSISPNLYVGVGVSGAIHHTVGMQSSRHIVAIVDDPDAPITELADFTVIGDLFEVVPQAIEALTEAGYTA